MKKIISLFKRDYSGTERLVYNEVVPGAEWVINGGGVATKKFDGTCCMIKDGKLYRRYDAKQGKTPPDGFIPVQEPDKETGHWPGWILVGDKPKDKWHREAFERMIAETNKVGEGTYELCGPKINANREKLSEHVLIKHGSVVFNEVPREFNALKEYLKDKEFEGIVWHHLDGRMVKIKVSDFWGK